MTVPQGPPGGGVKPVKLNYTLTGSGWAALEVTVQGQDPVTATASYLSDALLSLLKATHAIVSGSKQESWAWFAEEPGQYTIHLQVLPENSSSGSHGHDERSLRLRLSAEEHGWWQELEQEGPHLKLDAVVGLTAFGRALSATAHTLLQQHGLQGYKEQWVEHDFPLQELQALDAALGQQAAAEAAAGAAFPAAAIAPGASAGTNAT